MKNEVVIKEYSNLKLHNVIRVLKECLMKI